MISSSPGAMRYGTDGVAAQRHHAAHELAPRGRHRDQHFVDALAARRRAGSVGGRAEHGKSVDALRPRARARRRENPTIVVLVARAVGNLARQHAAGFAGADDDESFRHRNDQRISAMGRCDGPVRDRRCARCTCRCSPGIRLRWSGPTPRRRRLHRLCDIHELAFEVVDLDRHRPGQILDLERALALSTCRPGSDTRTPSREVGARHRRSRRNRIRKVRRTCRCRGCPSSGASRASGNRRSRAARSRSSG